jgi:hypothetical protein
MLAKIAKWAAIAGVVANTTGFIMRWKESYASGYGHAPLSNMYESLVYLCHAAACSYDEGVVREKDCLPLYSRIRSSAVHLLWRELPAGTAQLRIIVVEIIECPY